MQINAATLAHLLNGSVEGNPEAIITHPAKIEEAGEGSITFLANPKYEEFAYSTGATVLLVSRDFAPKKPVAATLVRVDDVYASITFLLQKFGDAAQTKTESGISAQASVHPSATVAASATVGPFVVIEADAVVGEGAVLHPQVYVGKGARIGGQTTLHSGVKVYHGCVIGDRCLLHANAVVGSDGFGFAPQPDGSYQKIPQLGNVCIEDDVEIGANTVIDRATMGSTYIRKGVKLDNLIQIAHNVEIGSNTVIAAQTGIAGSTKIGQRAMIGGQVGIVGHIKIADGTKIQAQSGVNASITDQDTAIYGSPAMPYHQFLRAYAVFRRLPEVDSRLRAVEKKTQE